MKISEGFPKVLEEGGVTAKIYKSFIKDKYDLFTLAYYMDGKFLKENFGQLDDAIARFAARAEAATAAPHKSRPRSKAWSAPRRSRRA